MKKALCLLSGAENNNCVSADNKELFELGEGQLRRASSPQQQAMAKLSMLQFMESKPRVGGRYIEVQPRGHKQNLVEIFSVHKNESNYMQ